MAVWLPRERVRRGGSLTVWALLRAAPRSSARIAYRVGSGAWTTLAAVPAPRTARGELTARVRPPASGQLRVEARLGGSTLVLARRARAGQPDERRATARATSA